MQRRLLLVVVVVVVLLLALLLVWFGVGILVLVASRVSCCRFMALTVRGGLFTVLVLVPRGVPAPGGMAGMAGMAGIVVGVVVAVVAAAAACGACAACAGKCGGVPVCDILMRAEVCWTFE